MPNKNSLLLEIVGPLDSRKTIKMSLSLGSLKLKNEFKDVTSLLLALDKILKANKMGITAFQIFKAECPDTEDSLACTTAKVIKKAIQYFK